MDPKELEEYLENLHEKLRERQLTSFWVMADRKDFKVIKMERKEIETYLKENVQHYRNKRIAWIRCYVQPNNLKKENMFVMSIKVMIAEISEDGEIDRGHNSTYGLCVNFYPTDFPKMKFSLKLVESLLRLAAAKKKKQVQTDPLNGLSYEDFKEKLRSKGIDWEYM